MCKQKVLKYEGMPGEHIAASANNAIALAAKHNCRVRMVFNGIALAVTKHMSASHVVRTWEKVIAANELRYKNSSAAKKAKAKRDAEIYIKQQVVDSLILYLPESKEQAAEWISKWVPMADDVDVDGRGPIVSAHLRSLGFLPSQHVGDSDLANGTASRMKKIEYIAGQAISMIESVGRVHPIIGQWAKEASGAL